MARRRHKNHFEIEWLPRRKLWVCKLDGQIIMGNDDRAAMIALYLDRCRHLWSKFGVAYRLSLNHTSGTYRMSRTNRNVAAPEVFQLVP